MRGLLQRVRRAAVAVDGAEVGAIQQGVLLLLGIAHADTVASADTLLDRVLRYRLFPDAQGRMNLSLADSGGGLLIVSQFTLMADTRKGLRPSFTSAAPPVLGRELFERAVDGVLVRGDRGGAARRDRVRAGPRGRALAQGIGARRFNTEVTGVTEVTGETLGMPTSLGFPSSPGSRGSYPRHL